MGRWETGERTVEYLISRGRLEGLTAGDFGPVAEALLGRATLRVGTSARAVLDGRTRHQAGSLATGKVNPE